MYHSADRILVEGEILYRDRQKWRSRWCCMKKTNSAGAPLTQLLVYPTKPADSRASPNERHSLEDFCGLDGSHPLEGEEFVLSVITAHITYTLAFRSMHELERWSRILKRELGSEWMFGVKVLPTQTKIKAGEATLRFFPSYFSLTSGNPATCLGYWMHNQLRRYGGSTGFSFEAGSKCYGGEGVYRLESEHGAKIKDLFDRVANNKKLPNPPSSAVPASRYPLSSSATPTDTPPALPSMARPSLSDSSGLYTTPPSAGPKEVAPSRPRFSSSSSTSSVAPPSVPLTPPGLHPTDHATHARPPCKLPRRPSKPDVSPEEMQYMNVQPMPSAYTYVQVPAQRPIEDGRLTYMQVNPGSPPASAATLEHSPPGTSSLLLGSVGVSGGVSGGGGTSPRGTLQPTDYADIDFVKSRHINQALQAQATYRQRPIDQ